MNSKHSTVPDSKADLLSMQLRCAFEGHGKNLRFDIYCSFFPFAFSPDHNIIRKKYLNVSSCNTRNKCLHHLLEPFRTFQVSVTWTSTFSQILANGQTFCGLSPRRYDHWICLPVISKWLTWKPNNSWKVTQCSHSICFNLISETWEVNYIIQSLTWQQNVKKRTESSQYS